MFNPNEIAKHPPRWHALSAEGTFEKLASAPDGLGVEEARARLERFGPNRIRPPRRMGPLRRFLLQFHNVVIYVLIGAAVVAGALDHWIDTGVIAAVVLINALIGFIQEGKAEKALEAVRRMLSPMAVVLRGAQRRTVPAEEVAPGDVVVLQSGDKAPADLRLFKTKDLRIDESMLTGESVPVEKSVEPVAENAPLGDRRCLAFSGTLVTYGQGLGVVVATGDNTEIGRISAMLEGVEPLTTPLLRQISQFGRVLSAVIVGGALVMFAFGVLVRGYTYGDMFMAAVAVAVAAIPEGLPAIITITLAIGVQRMARRHAIIRRLPAVDTLGSVTVICCDKTGTLTRNEMTVKSLVTPERTYEVSGTGYDPEGGFSIDGTSVLPGGHGDLIELVRGGLLCNDAAVRPVDGEWRLEGDPTDGALVTAALKAELDPALENAVWRRRDEIPFESQHRFMATLHHDNAGEARIYVKGAPEKVLALCRAQGAPGAETALDERRWREGLELVASRGERVIAVAVKRASDHHSELLLDDVSGGLAMLGLFGLMDPPREEAIAAVRQGREAGIRVKMITGDYALTAGVIAERLGIGDGKTVVTGQEVDELDDAGLRDAAERADVFARVSPEHKLRLVQAIQANGHVVAMTGDGVNDAPALKRADVGVAMGLKGTEVAKEAADMVLTDDHFASIAHAIEEGRTVYDNLRKAILFILPTNGAEAAVIIGAILLGRSLPITPVQVLWINLVTAVTLALALAFEPSEPDVMRRPPRKPGEPLLSRFFIWRIGFVSLLLFAATFGIFLWMRQNGADLATARTAAVNMLVMLEVAYLFNARFIVNSSLGRAGALGNRYALLAAVLVILLQLVYTYLPLSERLFGTAPIGAATWISIGGLAAAVFLVIELEKAFMRRYVAPTRASDAS